MKGKVLFVQGMDNSGKKLLEDNGYELVFAEKEDPEIIAGLIADCDAAFSKTFFLTEDILDAGEKLKVVAKHGVGIDNVVDLQAATKRGIYVVNTPCANSNSVAERTLGGILAFSQKTIQQHMAVKRHDFEFQNCGGMHEVLGKTIGIVGLGNIGRRVAKMASEGFSMKVIGYDPYVKAEALPTYIRLTKDLNEVLRESDFLSLHLGASPETIGMMGKEQFALMKKSAVFVNMARGALVKEAELEEALKNGEIAGAVLDVYSTEPPREDNPLIALDNVLLSPHCAALTDEAMANMSYDGAKGILEILSGKTPTWCLNYEEVNRGRGEK